MKIDCYISTSCSSEEALTKIIYESIKLESVDAEVNILKIDEAEAKRLKLMGSPSVLINGEDILPGNIPGIS
ncbi:MAG TPA: hypothetical protein DDX85_02145 [Nitrospiraceae bacterium]|nr:hypothetical protein [Nitrospiraceae bacterium]